MSVRDALDNAFSDWFHGEGVENKTDDSPGDAAIAALRALLADWNHSMPTRRV